MCIRDSRVGEQYKPNPRQLAGCRFFVGFRFLQLPAVCRSLGSAQPKSGPQVPVSPHTLTALHRAFYTYKMFPWCRKVAPPIAHPRAVRSLQTKPQPATVWETSTRSRALTKGEQRQMVAVLKDHNEASKMLHRRRSSSPVRSQQRWHEG